MGKGLSYQMSYGYILSVQSDVFSICSSKFICMLFSFCKTRLSYNIEMTAAAEIY